MKILLLISALAASLCNISVTTSINNTTPCVYDTVTCQAIVSGGTSPYSFMWVDFITQYNQVNQAVVHGTSDTTNITLPVLVSGNIGYAIIVTDANGCVASAGSQIFADSCGNNPPAPVTVNSTGQ